MEQSLKIIKVYTDGSASVAGPLKGKSGFGTYFPDLFGRKKAFSLGFENGKTGEMEVLALLYAIRALPKKLFYRVKLEIYSDSEYVVKTFTEQRLEKWESNNWTNTSGVVANKELWIKILKEIRERRYLSLNLNHIKSHQVEKEKDSDKKRALLKNENIIGNLMADRLANYKRHTTRLKSTKDLKFI